MNVLIVLTSHDRLGDTGHKTGFWLEEFAAPYYVFKDAGAAITLASPAGGQPPLDPKSDEPGAQTAATERFRRDAEAQQQLASTLPLASVNVVDFDAVFYPGGHGPMWDLTNDAASIALLQTAERGGKPIGLVCHATGALIKVRGANGQPLIAGRKVTGFSNSEEAAVGLTTVVPFLIEDEFQRLGARYEKGADWHPNVVTDGRLVTGQNPASSEGAAKALLALLG
jgi:putative intracellular protease/amidase